MKYRVLLFLSLVALATGSCAYRDGIERSTEQTGARLYTPENTFTLSVELVALPIALIEWLGVPHLPPSHEVVALLDTVTDGQKKRQPGEDPRVSKEDEDVRLLSFSLLDPIERSGFDQAQRRFAPSAPHQESELKLRDAERVSLVLDDPRPPFPGSGQREIRLHIKQSDSGSILMDLWFYEGTRCFACVGWRLPIGDTGVIAHLFPAGPDRGEVVTLIRFQG